MPCKYIVQSQLDFFLNKNPKKVIVLLKGKSGTKTYVDFVFITCFSRHVYKAGSSSG